MYRREAEAFTPPEVATAENDCVLASNVAPLTFQLIAGEGRPRIEVKHVVDGNEKQQWFV